MFGEWLRQQRRRLDLTQQALADQAGCARISLRRIEKGSLKPSKDLALILLKIIGIPESDRTNWIPFVRGLADIPTKQIDFNSTRLQTNFPAFLTTFIGREKEQAEIITLISHHRLVTLTGSGGVGKTRLALKVGEQILGDYANGAWIIELASLNDPMLLAQTIAVQFGISTQADDAYTELLINFLHGSETLLILDNCEHLVDGCTQLADKLLKNCPNLKILATSREPLSITGEATYRVPSLELPDTQKVHEKLWICESMRLFDERAKLVQTDFALTVENASFVAKICQIIDGIPLAIELAAARVNMFSTEQIAEKLSESFSLLTGGSRSALPRQQTIRASIDWSWDLLSNSEKILAQRLSVFAGGWFLNAAESVCVGDGVCKPEILGLTTQLYNKSIILVDHQSGRPPRYHMLETIREYANEKLNNSGEMRNIYSRHLIFFAEMVDEAAKNFKGSEQALWYNRLDCELDNLRAALAWLDGGENTELRLFFAAGLWRYWKNRGLINEGRLHFERVLKIPSEPTLAFARALTAAGSLAYYAGDFSYSEQGRTKALLIFRSLNDKVGIADCLNGLGNTAISQGNYAATRMFYAESLAIRKELGDQWGIARLLGNLGLLAYFQIDYTQSRSLHLESLALFRELQDDEGVVNELVNLGDVLFCQKELSTANSFYQESAMIARRSKEQWGLPYAIKGMADVASEQGDLSMASSLYKECLAMFQAEADYIGLPFALESVAGLVLVNNRPEKAVQIFGAADALRKTTNSPLPLSNRATYQKNLDILQQKLDSSRFDLAWAIGRTMPIRLVIALALDELV